MRKKHLALIPAMALAFAATAAPPARADDDPEIESSDHARVSALAGELFIKGPFDEEEQAVTINYILREGDQVRTGPDTFVELELPHSTFVRLASHTAARVETIEGQVELHLIRGSSYLSQGPDAPDAAIVAELGGVGTFSRTVVRFESETGPNGYAIVRVAEGSAEASCEGKFTTLSVRHMMTCDQSGKRVGEWSPDKGDAFDRWNQEREKKVRTYQAPPAAVAGNYQGMQDLDGEGEWIVYEQKHYWRPYVEVSWRPYNDGYWAWHDWLGGWTWISYRPWGHVTHHYGRWIYVGHYGWVWAPAPRFGPAWVVWANFDGYLGWAPCDFWGRPIVVVSTHSHYDHYSWTFSRPHYFSRGGGNYRRVIKEPRDRPFYTFTPDEMRTVRARPVKDPRVLRPTQTIVQQRPEIATATKRPARVRKVREMPRESELPRIMEDDARRTRQVHEVARVRDPIAVPRREVARGALSDNDGIPVKLRQPPRVVERDNDVVERDRDREIIDRPDRAKEIERAGTPNGNAQPRHSPPVRRDDDRDQPAYQPPSKQPSYTPPGKQPSYQPPQRPATNQTPARKEVPRTTASSSSQSKPQYQPQPKPQAQPQTQSKPTYTPSKPAVKPSAPPNKKAPTKKEK